jgi:sulfur-oxidizing protein SoxX
MAGSRRSPQKSSAERRGALAGIAALAAVTAGCAHAAWAQAPEPLRPYTVVGDAIPQSLTGAPGNPERGRAIVVNRQVGLCLLCHSGPYPEEKFQGTLAPDLKGAGSRWSQGQLRLRIVDASRLKADTIMPPYYRLTGLVRVAPSFQGKPLLTAEQIEDVIAHLATLRD